MEAMQDIAITSLAIRSLAFYAASAVDIQKKIIAAMRSGDPGLPFAHVMLCLMQQSAATAEMNLYLCLYHEVAKKTSASRE